ncbi:TPA: four helix bundle protein [Candidatus Acetothermia bacterium]|nr:four helix bundle protein [Candidatus Acetothermia bacterium]
MSKTRTHKDLDVWNEAMRLARGVYRLSAHLPREEAYGLTAQLRRAAVSVPSNIAEGAARSSRKEFVQFLYHALGSLAEIETQLMLAKDLHNVQDKEVEETMERTRRMLLGLIRSLKQPRSAMGTVTTGGLHAN